MHLNFVRRKPISKLQLSNHWFLWLYYKSTGLGHGLTTTKVSLSNTVQTSPQSKVIWHLQFICKVVCSHVAIVLTVGIHWTTLCLSLTFMPRGQPFQTENCAFVLFLPCTIYFPSYIFSFFCCLQLFPFLF
jgi:hypothetical protein